MKKRFLSLLCVLALCLGLLPVTALAAAPGGQVIYVGNENVTSGGYWTTDSNGSVTAYTGEGPPADNFIHYDAGDNTLTLHNATIREYVYSGTSTYVMGAGIGVFNQNDASKLTIKLEGSNAIENVSTGIFVLAFSESTGSSSLTITGSGSLDASGSLNGIMVQSNSGDATLTIQSADVTLTSNSGNGVTVQAGSAGTQGHTATLTVNGGKLTASGAAGIEFNASNPSYNITTELTVSGNALVDTRNGGIEVYGTGAVNTTADDDATNGGIVFDGKDGTVYGNVELQKDLEIKSGETLTIPEGSTLNTNNNLTNNGTIVNTGGTLNGEPDGTGKIETTPTIDTQPASQTVTKGNTATFTVAATGENLSYQWQQSINSGSNWMDISGANVATYTTAATTTSMSGYQYRCVVSNSAGSVTSEVATLTVNEPAPTTYTITADVFPLGAGTATADKTTATAGDMVKLTATANSGYRFTGWTFSDNITDTDSSSATTTFTMPAGDVTVTANFQQYYIITVNASAGGTATADKTTAVAGEAVTLTATPDSGYHFDRWNIVSGTITIQNNQFTMPAGNVEIQAIFDRNSSGGSSTPTKTPSQQAVDKIESAKDGSTVEIKLSTGSTKLDKEVFEELAGRDVTLEISLPGGVSWTVNGQDIPENADLTDLDLGVTLDASTIPVSVINTVTGAVDTIQLSLAHNGERPTPGTGPISITTIPAPGRWSSSPPARLPLTVRPASPSPTPPTMLSSSTQTAMSRWSCPSPMCRRAHGMRTLRPMSTSTASWRAPAPPPLPPM